MEVAGGQSEREAEQERDKGILWSLIFRKRCF
jgi:hypothetical protein